MSELPFDPYGYLQGNGWGAGDGYPNMATVCYWYGFTQLDGSGYGEELPHEP